MHIGMDVWPMLLMAYFYQMTSDISARIDNQIKFSKTTFILGNDNTLNLDLDTIIPPRRN